MSETRSIYFSPEHDLFRDQIRRFVIEAIRPNADAWEAAGEVPRAVFREMGALGFLGARYGEEYGGAGMDVFASIVLAEELGRAGLSGLAAGVLVHTDMASPHLARFGSSEQKARYMPAIIRGEMVTAIAVTEPGAGSDVAGLTTRAERAGNGWILNGAKTFITNGALADLYFVATRTDPEAKSSRGLSLFIVERGTPGFEVARKLDKLGWHSSDTAELRIKDCRLPADALLGEEGRGFYQIMENFQKERLVIGAMAVGEAERAIEITLEHVRTRQAFGGPLWEKQTVRQNLADCAARAAAAKQLVHHTAWLDAQGIDCVREVSMVKVHAAEMVQHVAHTCLQLHGGSGYMRGMEIERLYRDARIHSIGGGATEVMHEEIAKRL
ncbi:MAG: acyl-CoA dehydrogenase family protein [Paracoccaceae bacterium]|nr:acyl-CoA dehydrogenase family protein [Paracoccaceae bacterium]